MVRKSKPSTPPSPTWDQGLVQVMTVSAVDNTNGKSVATITLLTPDGKQHTFKSDLDQAAKIQLRRLVNDLMKYDSFIPPTIIKSFDPDSV